MGISMGGFSGIDTDQMIQQLMYLERAPIRRMESKQEDLNEQIGVWQKINTSLDTLKTKATDIEGVFDEMTTESSDETVVTAMADSDAIAGSYNITVDQLAQVHRVASDQQDDSTSSLDLNGGNGGEFDITVDGSTATISVAGDDSLNDVADAINGQAVDADGNQLAEASIVDNRLVIESAETGTVNELSFTDSVDDGGDAGGVLQELGVVDGSNTIQNELQVVQDAQFDINGINDITRSSNEGIDDVVTGLTLDLEDAGSATVTVDTNQEKMVESIQSFVDQYNTLQDKLDKYGGKESVLQGDASLRSIESKIYDSVVKPVNSGSLDKDTLSLIGIEVDKDGKLSINQSELEDNLSNNLSDVKELFTAETDGVIDRVESQVDMATDMFDGYVTGRIDSLENEVSYLDDSILNMEERLEIREENLRQQFTRMEQAISEMENQGSWLSGQI